jgi:hypothetical protein
VPAGVSECFLTLRGLIDTLAAQPKFKFVVYDREEYHHYVLAHFEKLTDMFFFSFSRGQRRGL